MSATKTATPSTTDNKKTDAVTDEITKAAEAAGFDIGKLAVSVSLTSIYGACTACAVKKWTKDVAYGIGATFVLLQAASYYGFLTIHWGTVNKKIQSALDADGDGKFDMNDVKVYFRRFMNVMTTGLPDVAGFSVGFWTGIKYL